MRRLIWVGDCRIASGNTELVLMAVGVYCEGKVVLEQADLRRATLL